MTQHFTAAERAAQLVAAAIPFATNSSTDVDGDNLAELCTEYVDARTLFALSICSAIHVETLTRLIGYDRAAAIRDMKAALEQAWVSFEGGDPGGGP